MGSLFVVATTRGSHEFPVVCAVNPPRVPVRLILISGKITHVPGELINNYAPFSLLV